MLERHRKTGVTMIRGPMKLISGVLIEYGVLCAVPGNIDKCEGLAHITAVSSSIRSTLVC